MVATQKRRPRALLKKGESLAMLFGLFVFMLIMSCTEWHITTNDNEEKGFATLIEADSITSAAPLHNMPPSPHYTFRLVWQAASYPEVIYWRPSAGWQICHAIVLKRARAGKSELMKAQRYGEQLSAILPGDTLELTTINSGKFRTPVGIPPDARYTLFFKTAEAWLALPVTNLQGQ